MSSLAPLLDAIRKMSATELHLVPGERIYVIREGLRRDIGRDPVNPASINKLLEEVLGTDSLLAARAAPQSTRTEQEGLVLDVIASAGDNGIMACLRVVGRGGAGTEPPSSSSASPLSSDAFALHSAPQPASSRPNVVLAMDTPMELDIGASSAQSIDALLREMVVMQASDLHLTAGMCPVMRVHGDMKFMSSRPNLTSDEIRALVRGLGNEQAIREFDEHRDADFAYAIPGFGRFRVNLFVDQHGAGAVFRHIPSQIIPLESYGLPQQAIDLCKLSKGLVLVTGPTGSGKSTTLASMVDYINRTRSDHVITIEDPIEFVHPHHKCLVNQREVGQHTGSFKKALRAALREDPDVVLVGEMRDLETISIALETAETGHLVFGTLHTTTAASAVDRIIDQFPAEGQQQIRVMLADALKGVIAQLLCRQIGGGRVPAMEILLGSSALTALIREGKTHQIPSILQTGRQAGMISFADSLTALVQRRVITAEEAWLRASDRNQIATAFKTVGIPPPGT